MSENLFKKQDNSTHRLRFELNILRAELEKAYARIRVLEAESLATERMLCQSLARIAEALGFDTENQIPETNGVRECLAAIEGLKDDMKRLDWLETVHYCREDAGDETTYFVDKTTASTVRSAIDAAMGIRTCSEAESVANEAEDGAEQ